MWVIFPSHSTSVAASANSIAANLLFPQIVYKNISITNFVHKSYFPFTHLYKSQSPVKHLLKTLSFSWAYFIISQSPTSTDSEIENF